MESDSNTLTASFYRCVHGEGFIDTFYDRFLAKGPEIARKFVATDFKIQKLMLRQSLLEMIAFNRGLSGTDEEVDRLGHRHKEMGITREMYSLWLDSLCEAIQQHDPEYTPELEDAWRSAMQRPIEQLLAIAGFDE